MSQILIAEWNATQIVDSPAGLGAAHGAEDRRHDEGEVLDADGVPTPAPYRAPIAWNRAGAEQEYRAAYRAARGG